MKRTLLFPFALVACFGDGWALAQSSEPVGARELRDRLMRQERITLSVLLGYGGLSMVTGAGLLVVDDPFTRGVSIQQLAWGSINAAIAGAGLVQLAYEARHNEPEAHWQKQRTRLRRILWVNAALDVLYVGAGAALWSLSESDRSRGTGAGIVIQGAGLLVFDSSAALSV